MAFAINTNVASLQAQNSLRLTGDLQSKTINRVTSGLRIVASGDDAAGLAIANTYRSDGAVLAQGVRNANDGLSQLQTADGGINNISQLLDRARTLATQSASGAFTGDRSVLNSEFQSVIAEIDRQAQAVGLNTGGQFAKALSVFIGGGQSSNGISATTNGSVSLDLSRSTVDAASLGLKGVQAKGVAGTDIGSGSASTSLSTILANATNTDSVSIPGFTTFVLKGPGFDGNGVKLSVNTANLGGTSDLASAVNAAIQAASNGGTQEATALKNAGIIAGINTDSNGRQQLTFSSPSTAFQVVAGDRLASALLGKFEQNATLTGSDTGATVATNGGGTADRLTLAVDGGLAFNVDVTNAATVSKGQIVKDLNADASFSEVATAYLEGNQIVLKSKANSSSSSIKLTSTTLATNLGLSTTQANAASASTGADLRTRVTAAKETGAGSGTFGTAGAGTLTVRFQGAGLESPVDVSVNVTALTTVNQAIAALDTAVANNSSLKAAGITLGTSTAGNTLTFESTSGQAFNVQVTGDVQNKLGFGSFVTGSNGAVDYTTISGGADYDRTTAVGTNTFEISLNGAASSSHSIAVDLTGGDATAATVTASNTATSVAITANNNKLNLSVNGHSYNVTLNINGAASKNDIADQINTAISAQGTAKVVGNAIVIESNTKGAGGSIQINNGTANTILGLAAATPLYGQSRTGASIAQALNQAFASDATLQAAGLVADFGTTTANRVTIKSASGVDTYFRVNSLGSVAEAEVVSATQQTTYATAGQRTLSGTGTYTITAGVNDQISINVDGAGAFEVTLSAGANRTVASIAAELNTKPSVVAAGATASVVGGALVLTSNTTGTGSSIAIAAGTNNALVTLTGTAGTTSGAAVNNGFAISAGVNDKVYVSVDGGATQTFTLTAGAARTAAQIAADFSAATGFTVTDDNGHLKFLSTASGGGSTIEFKTGATDAYTTLGLTSATEYSGTQAETGFGVAGASFTGNVNSAAPTVAGDIEAGGASQSSAFTFAPISFGSDDQTVTVTASDPNGVQQSSTITLRNDATARSGRSIDEAISAINTALQQTNNATLQKIVAVKDNSEGVEKVRFLSTVGNFRVSIGTTGNSTGIGSQGTTDTATLADGGSTASIVDVTSAQAAVTALADAVNLLGKAQAVVGRGQNQFAFAINLAQSQLTNLAAAESRIRDADLAAESANLTKSQILLQAGIAALAQANSAPQQVLALLRG